MQETQETPVWSLGWKDPQEEEMATHSSVLAWTETETEEFSGLQSMGSQRVDHNWVTEHEHSLLVNIQQGTFYFHLFLSTEKLI